MPELTLNVEKLKDKKILFGTPMYGGKCFGDFCYSMIITCSKLSVHNIQYDINYIMGESLITRARNFICDYFMRNNYDYLIFLDADIKFKPEDIFTLLYYALERDDMKIICGAYPKKEINWESVKSAVLKGKAENPNDLSAYTSSYFINPLEDKHKLELSEPQEILYGGTGFMLIKKEVFDIIRKKHPKRLYKNDHPSTDQQELMAYFDCIIDKKSKRYLSEDYMFCQTAKDLGISTWVIPWLDLTHIGTYYYTGSMGNLGNLQQENGIE